MVDILVIANIEINYFLIQRDWRSTSNVIHSSLKNRIHFEVSSDQTLIDLLSLLSL